MKTGRRIGERCGFWVTISDQIPRSFGATTADSNRCKVDFRLKAVSRAYKLYSSRHHEVVSQRACSGGTRFLPDRRRVPTPTSSVLSSQFSVSCPSSSLGCDRMMSISTCAFLPAVGKWLRAHEPHSDHLKRAVFSVNAAAATAILLAGQV